TRMIASCSKAPHFCGVVLRFRAAPARSCGGAGGIRCRGGARSWMALPCRSRGQQRLQFRQSLLSVRQQLFGFGYGFLGLLDGALKRLLLRLPERRPEVIAVIGVPTEVLVAQILIFVQHVDVDEADVVVARDQESAPLTVTAGLALDFILVPVLVLAYPIDDVPERSEERRVGKECRSRLTMGQCKTTVKSKNAR